MHEITFDSVTAFNAELQQIAATGLPIELGFGDSGETLAGSLDTAMARLRVDVGRGLSIDQAIATAPYLPCEYRTALETWASCGKSMVALYGPTTTAAAQLGVQRNFTASLIQPAIVLCLVYLGFISLCWVTAPKLEAIYAQQLREPGRSLAFLQRAREWMPVWMPLVPLALLLTAGWLFFRGNRLRFSWLPGSSRYFDFIRKANYAERLAKLLECNHSLAQALSIAGTPPADAAHRHAMETATEHLIQAENTGQRVASNDPALQVLPSILRWAVAGDLDGESMPDFLRFAARNYRHGAQRQAANWSTWMPAVGMALLGGLLVMGYSLSLFLPYIELLKVISLPRGV